jgi:hypothetical protein
VQVSLGVIIDSASIDKFSDPASGALMEPGISSENDAMDALGLGTPPAKGEMRLKPIIEDNGTVELCIAAILPLLQCFHGSREILHSSYLEILWLIINGIQNDAENPELITKLISIYHIAASGECKH